MKKFTFLTTMMLCGFLFSANAQLFIKIDASFYSEALDEVKMVDIYLPGDYYQHPELQYATIYYLHGAGGNQNSGYEKALWYYNLHSDNTTITSPPAIFVCPDGSCPPYMGSNYVNSELYGNYEDFIMQDVIGFIENNFRAYPDKNFRMITGLSMGGFGSSRLAATYPEKFRASFPCIGFPSMPDTLLNTWKDMYYEEHGNYIPVVTGGENTQLLFTMCGGFTPNMSNPPTYVDFPFDTLGNWVDTILNKWYNYDVSRLVKTLPDENELAWFLGCGTTDYMCTYPTYLQFMDSLDYYNIAYDYHFFEGGHIFNPETWMNGMLWMDSIINQTFISGIKPSNSIQGQITIFPNPVKDRLTVNFDGKMTMFEIINTTGRVVKSQKIEMQHTEMKQFYIDLSNLSPGIYFLRLQAGNDVVTKKIIKL